MRMPAQYRLIKGLSSLTVEGVVTSADRDTDRTWLRLFELPGS